MYMAQKNSVSEYSYQRATFITVLLTSIWRGYHGGASSVWRSRAREGAYKHRHGDPAHTWSNWPPWEEQSCLETNAIVSNAGAQEPHYWLCHMIHTPILYSNWSPLLSKTRQAFSKVHILSAEGWRSPLGFDSDRDHPYMQEVMWR